MSQQQERSPHVPEAVGPEALKALAHPLRVAIFDAIAHGPATASMLAEQLGESSGATSYHLRQLARHGLVREAADLGRGRERWWEKIPGGVVVGAADPHAGPAEKAAARMVVGELLSLREKALRAYVSEAESFDAGWQEATLVSTAHVDLPQEVLSELTTRMAALVDEYVDAYGRGRPSQPGSRPVTVQIAAFPVVGGTEAT